MMKRHWLTITAGALALAACNKDAGGNASAAVAGTNADSITVNGVTYTKAGTTTPAPGQPSAAAPASGGMFSNASSSAPAAGVSSTPPADFFAYGRWYGVSSDCHDLSKVEFTATTLVMLGPDGAIKGTQSIAYTNVTATSFTLLENDGGHTQPIASVTGSANGLTLTSIGRAQPITCMMVRHAM